MPISAPDPLLDIAGLSTGYGKISVLRGVDMTVRAGECVTGGERIGLAGSTGSSTGPHLHFEVRVRGAVVDPLRAFL